MRAGVWLTDGAAGRGAGGADAAGALGAGRGAGAVADRGLARAPGASGWYCGLARLERTAAHDSVLGCGHLDRRGRRGDDHLGGAGGLDRRGRAPGSAPPARARRPARAHLWLGDGDGWRAPRPWRPPSSSSCAAAFAGLASSGCSGRISPSRSARRRTRSAWASSMLEEWLLTPIPRATQRSSVSLLVSPSSLASSWTRIFAGKGAVSLSDGVWGKSVHVRASRCGCRARWLILACPGRFPPIARATERRRSIRICVEADPQGPPKASRVGPPGPGRTGCPAQSHAPRPGSVRPDQHATGPIRDHPAPGRSASPAPAAADAGADGPAVSSAVRLDLDSRPRRRPRLRRAGSSASDAAPRPAARPRRSRRPRPRLTVVSLGVGRGELGRR